MAWPTATDYNEAVQDLRRNVVDEELRAGRPALTPLDLPMIWSGNFADVYKIHDAKSGNAWALKCFTRKVPGQADRYQHISTHLQRARLPFMVDFRYLDQGIRVHGEWYPALKMDWVEGGIPLNQFVEQYLNRPRTLKLFLGLWVKTADRLRQAKMAHADLQHGNVLLVPRGERGVQLRLIDYDGMYVPAFAGSRSAELGHPAFQHPQRSRAGIYSAEVDRFSNLAIYSAIHCLTVGRQELWDRFDNSDNLLFREEDFQYPANSEVFHTLWELPDEDSRALAGRLILACTKPLDQSPLLDEVTNGQVYPLTSEEAQAVESILGGKTQVHPAAVVEPVESASPPPLPEPGPTGKGLPEWMSSPETLETPAAQPDGLRLPASAVPRRSDQIPEELVGEENVILAELVDEQHVTPLKFLCILIAVVLQTAVVSLFVYALYPLSEPDVVTTPPQFPASAGGPYSGNEGSDITLDASASSGRGSEIVSYAWDFDGDGQYDDASGVTAVFNSIDDGVFTVALQVTDDEGAKSTDTAQVTVSNVAPKADAGWRYTVEEGDNLRLDASGSSDPGQDIVSYEWDLDRDRKHDDASGVKVMFNWTKDGVFSVAVLVTDDDGANSTDTAQVTVGNVAPTADAGGPYIVKQGDKLTLDASASSDPGQDIVSYKWDFDGDGKHNDGSGVKATHKWTEDGVFSVVLLVTDDDGAASTDTAQVIVRNVAPTAKPLVQPEKELSLAENHTNSIGMKFKLIQPGEFLMGSPADDPDKSSKETPQHRVRITKPYYLGVYEVTQGEYQKVMGKNPSEFKGLTRPVEQVSWEDATEFCRKLSQMDTRFNYRLPTEAEWEYACRAGTKTRYICGDDLDPDYGWVNSNSSRQTHPVGKTRPNAWGLYDMHGNVYEWCQDWYDSGYYGSSPSDDPMGASTGSTRVLRGGCWSNRAPSVRSAYRDPGGPGFRFHFFGFRVARVPAD